MENRSLVTIAEHSREKILYMLEMAKQFEKNPNRRLLEGKVVATLFFEPSTRTRLSFETAANRLGARVIGFSDPKATSSSKGETLKDTIMMVSNYADVIVMRHYLEGAARYASEVAPVPIVNAGDGANQHPSQTMLDLYSIYKTQGTLENLNIYLVGDLKYGRTVHSLLMAMRHFNPTFHFIAPEELKMPEEYKIYCKEHNIKYENGAIDIGVRAEIPDIIMKEINENFYEAKMIYYSRNYRDKMRTFCSNPSGFIAAEKYEDDFILANGHAYKDRKSTNTNLALLCTKKFTEPFNQPFEYATAIAKMSSMLTGGKLLVQSYIDLKAGRRSTDEKLSRLNIIPTTEDYVAGDIALACPQRLLDNIMEFIEVLDKITPGFASGDLLLYFPEIKFRSTRIEISENMETSIEGLYAAGDSSGYGSGLNIAAVMGILAVRNILTKL